MTKKQCFLFIYSPGNTVNASFYLLECMNARNPYQHELLLLYCKDKHLKEDYLISPNTIPLLFHPDTPQITSSTLEYYTTIETARQFPGILGSSQGFFNAIAIIGCHIGGKDRSEMSQYEVQIIKTAISLLTWLPVSRIS